MVKPFLKWVGGKTQLIPEINQIITNKFSQFDRFNYLEPFVGGGAFLFHVLEHFSNLDQVVINDINTQLINAYKLIKNDLQSLINLLLELEEHYYSLTKIEEKKEFFLLKRKEFNQNNENFCQEKKNSFIIIFK